MPVMDFDEEKYDNVLREAQDVEMALQGKKVPNPFPSIAISDFKTLQTLSLCQAFNSAGLR